MSTKLKMLGLGLFAMLAMGAFGVMNATAEEGGEGGHFTSGSHETTITGLETATDFLEFYVDSNKGIRCRQVSYHGTMGTTTNTLTITPSWSDCYTTDSTDQHFEIHENGCDFKFTANTEPATTDSSAHVVCPEGKQIEITHPNCVVKVPAQTAEASVTYTTHTWPDEETHAITLDVHATGVTAHYESGLCVLLGTNHTGKMEGSVTVVGEDEETGDPIEITATGE